MDNMQSAMANARKMALDKCVANGTISDSERKAIDRQDKLENKLNEIADLLKQLINK